MKWWKKLCAAALALSMPVLASAEAKLVDTQTFARSITLGRASDTYVMGYFLKMRTIISGKNNDRNIPANDFSDTGSGLDPIHSRHCLSPRTVQCVCRRISSEPRRI